MRFIFFFFMMSAGIMAMSQSTSIEGKKVTVHLSNITLEEALTILSISYDVPFSYSNEAIPLEAVIQLDIENESLEAALKKLLDPLQIGFKKTSRGRIVLLKRSGITQTVRGRITDRVTDNPIPGATVMLEGENQIKGTTTDERGMFRFDNIPVGRISLNVTSIGFDRHDINEMLLTSAKEVVINVKLTESVTAMKEVVVNGLRFDGVPGEGVALTSSRSFSVEDTKRFAGSLGDPARMATAFAGVTGNDDNNALIIRGNSPRGILWRVEGIEIPNPNHFTPEGSSHGVVSILSSNVIDRSDFLTGAFPAQYGNALSGVFDISLRNGNSENREYSVQAGLLGIEASAEGPFSNKKANSYLVNYRYSTLSILDNVGIDLNSVGQYKGYQDLMFKLNFPLRSGNVSLFGIGGMSKSVLTDTTVFDNDGSDVGTVGLSYKRILGNNTVMTTGVAVSGTKVLSNSAFQVDTARFIAVTEDYSKSFLRLFLSARKKLTVHSYVEGGFTLSGLEYNFFLRNADSGNQAYPVVVNFRERGTSFTAQGFLYNRQYISEKFFAFYGLHMLYFSMSQDKSIEPRGGVKWRVSDLHSLSLGIGKHSRIENLQYYLARDHQRGGREIQINRNLGFTRSNHLVATHAFSKGNNHLKTELYYQWLYNAPVQLNGQNFYTTINEDAGFITDTLVNRGRGKNYGVEVSFERPFLNGLYYLLNATVYRSLFSIDSLPERNTAYHGNFAARAMAGKELNLGNDGKLGFNVKFTYAGGRPYVPINLEESRANDQQVLDWSHAFQYRFGNYFRSDLQLVYRINRSRYSSEWRLDIQNITDHRNPAHYYYDKASKNVRIKYQIGILPLITYRIEF